MFLRVLPVSAPLSFLLFFSTFVVAQVNVTANCTLSTFAWTFNSLGQSPCLVAGYMLSTCWGGSYWIIPLTVGITYQGPWKNYDTKCDCSTIGYSLLAACSKCQGVDMEYWNTYVFNCTTSTLVPPSTFPNPVPAGIRVPRWASLDVTNENNWSANGSQAAGDNPEYGPGTIINGAALSISSASASSSSTVTPSPTPSTPPTPGPPKGKTSNGGAIAGGVVGGIAAISIVILAILFLRRRRPQAASAGVGASQASQPMQIAQSPPRSPLIMKLYDPNDPTTFPGQQGRPQSLGMSSASPPLSSYIGSGSTLPDMQTSQPHARGYHGLPQPA